MFALFLALGVVFAHAQLVCDPANASDTPFTTGCAYCSPDGGCRNGGTCYSQPISPSISIPYCSCPYGFLSRFFLSFWRSTEHH
jgi:hypothetical protein